jgi:hypothetical protein
VPRASKPTDPWSTFVDLFADTLAARLDFPPRASSAASALNPSPAEGAPASDPARRKEKRRVPARSAGVRRNIRRNPS